MVYFRFYFLKSVKTEGAQEKNRKLSGSTKTCPRKMIGQLGLKSVNNRWTNRCKVVGRVVPFWIGQSDLHVRISWILMYSVWTASSTSTSTAFYDDKLLGRVLRRRVLGTTYLTNYTLQGTNDLIWLIDREEVLLRVQTSFFLPLSTHVTCFIFMEVKYFKPWGH